MTIARLLSTLHWDVRLQYRQGLPIAALVVVAVWGVVLTQLPLQAQQILLPFALFMDVSIFGFYFMAGILYLEKGEGVLEALVVTPLPRGAYLLSKLLSLTLLSVAACIALTLVVHGAGGVNWLWLIVGTALNSWLLTLVGFLLAVRYTAINEFIVPSILWMIPTQLPLVWWVGLWDHGLLYVMPTQGAMILMGGAFTPPAAWQIAYAFAILLGACALVTWLAVRAYARFVVEKVR